MPEGSRGTNVNPTQLGLVARLIGHTRSVASVRKLPILSRIKLFICFLGLMSGRTFTLRVPGGATLVFPARSRHEDRLTFYEIWRWQEYGDNFRNTTVLDFGAHKGYFGAYAIANGASEVISFEPEPMNFHALDA